MKKYRIPLKDNKENLAFRFSNTHLNVNDDEVSLKYNNEKIATFTSKSLKGNKLAQAIFDLLVSYSKINLEKGINLIKTFDDLKSKNRLNPLYDKDANFYQALKNKSNEDIADKQNRTTKIDYVQNLVNYLLETLGEQPIDLSSAQTIEGVQETGNWELVKITNGSVASNVGRGMGCCIFGNSPGSGARVGESNALSALKATSNRQITDYYPGGSKSFVGSYTTDANSCYYVMRDPSRPNNSNNGDRYVIILIDKYHWTMWNDVDSQQIICCTQMSDFDIYKAEHGEEGKYMETVFPTPHFVDMDQATVFVKRLQLLNSTGKKILADYNITPENMLEAVKSWNEKMKKAVDLLGKAIKTNALNYSGGRNEQRNRELENPEARAQREAEEARKNEMIRLLKTMPITDELRFDVCNGFITFRFSITQSMYDRNNLKRRFPDYFKDIQEVNEDNIDENTQIEQRNETIKLDQFSQYNIGNLLANLIDLSNNNEEGNAIPLSFKISYIVRPKVIADFLILDSLRENDSKQLNRSEEVINLDSHTDKDKITKLKDLFVDRNSALRGLFNFLNDYYKNLSKILTTPFKDGVSQGNKSFSYANSYVRELMKKPIISNDDAKKIVASIIDNDINQHKFDVGYYIGEKSKYQFFDQALQSIFKTYNNKLKDTLNFTFPEEIFYDNINFNNAIEKSSWMKTLTLPTSNKSSRDSNFLAQIINIFFSKYYSKMRNASRGSGKKMITGTLSDSDIEDFTKDINALHISLITSKDFEELDKKGFDSRGQEMRSVTSRNHTPLTEDDINNILNGSNISQEEAEEINNNNAMAIQERSNNIAKSEEEEEIKDYKDNNFFTNSNDLPRIDNINNANFEDIEWADGYALHKGIINRIAINNNTVKSFLTNYKQALDTEPSQDNPNPLEKFFEEYSLSRYLMSQINKRFTNGGKYEYLFDLLSSTSTSSNEESEQEEQQEPEVQEEQVEEPEIIEEEQEEEIEEPEIIEEEQQEEQEQVEEPEVEEIDVDEDDNEENYRYNNYDIEFLAQFQEVKDIIEQIFDTFNVSYTEDNLLMVYEYMLNNHHTITGEDIRILFNEEQEIDEDVAEDIAQSLTEEIQDLVV